MDSKELKREYTNEETGISYTLVGDYYVPNLVLNLEERVILNKYGRKWVDLYIKIFRHKCRP